MLENSDDFSDELDEFEESQDDSNLKKKARRNLFLCSCNLFCFSCCSFFVHLSYHQNATNFQNKPYDEAYEVSQDLSMAESYDGRDKVSRTPYLIVVSSNEYLPTQQQT